MSREILKCTDEPRRLACRGALIDGGSGIWAKACDYFMFNF